MNGCLFLIFEIICAFIIQFIMLQVPPQLNFNQLQTKAFFSVYKPWPIEPISNGGQYWPGQVIRIFFNSLTQGVMDPYRSHIQFTVSCDVQTLPVGLLQVDNSAQSFVQQLVISSNNRQIQRIVQSGILASYLVDIGLSERFTQGRQSEGLGYSNIDNYSSIYNTTLSPPTSGMMYDWAADGTQSGKWMAYHGTGNVFPTIPTKTMLGSSWGDAGISTSPLGGVCRGHINWLNSAWLDAEPGNPPWWSLYTTGSASTTPASVGTRQANIQYYGYNNNIRAQYIGAYHANDYCDSTSSLSKGQIHLSKNTLAGNFPGKFTNGTVYQTLIPDNIGYYFEWKNSLKQDVITATPIPNLCSNTGYTTLVSPNFAKGVRQPFISPTVPQAQIANGKITLQKFPISRRTFKVPLLSAVMGLLIPQKQFVLLPLKAISTVLLQLTIDPYAMFTSGYNDVSEFDDVGMGLMQKRAFKIERVVYNLHTYQFYNPQMDEYIRVSLSSGIAINTHFWQLGNQYQVQNSQSLTNSWPVACNQEALNQILILFVPLDYQNLSFCRKHFRLSNNITKFQLRINMEYYPSQPLTGNGGNVIQYDSTGDNSIFIDQIYMSNGFYLSSTPQNVCRINGFNFALNDRIYNPLKTHTFYDPTMKDSYIYTWANDSINTDTAMGMPNVHENRAVGKAAYTFSFQPYSHSKQFLTGIDCRAAKSFEVLLTCNPQNWFPRPQSMFIYTRSSVIIQYSKEGIVNINK